MTDDFFAKLDSFFDGSVLLGVDRADLRLRVLTDHFASLANPSADELTRIEAMLGDALVHASSTAAGAAAGKLAQHPHTTASLLATLIALGGEAAEAAVRWGRGVPRAALVAAAEHGTTAVAAALAARENLDPALATVLFRRTERAVLLALTANSGVTLDRVTAAWLIQRARHDDELARAILSRKPLGCDLTPLFLAADETERAAMLAAARRRDLGVAPEYRPTPSADNAVEQAIARRDRTALAETLARRLGISRNDAARLIDDSAGEALALALNAANVLPHHTATILSWLQKRAADDPKLARLLALAGDFPSRTARRILSAVFSRPIAKHQSPAASSDAPSRAGKDRAEFRTDPLRDLIRIARQSSQ